jgi:uncharacterized membrane protein YgaE (UPF0421/DUF939 family)
MKISIGYRTIKTAVGTGIAIALAEWLGLQFYVSAGMITILCIQPTRKKSYRAAWKRFLACLIGMLLSGVVFEILGGYRWWTLTFLLLLFIPVAVALKIAEGVTTGSLIILHLYTFKTINLKIVINEMELFIIGIGVALLVNLLYMPNLEKKLKTYQQNIENDFREILYALAVYLRAGGGDWDEQKMRETSKILEKAKILAWKDLENHFYEQDFNYYRYFEMRERQFEVLEGIVSTISSLRRRYSQGMMIADFLDDLAGAIHAGNTTSIYLDQLDRLRKQFQQQSLPKDRLEFETRAALLHLVNEMQRYLLIKRDLIQD